MSNSHLSPCPSCARHVRIRETSCPFCGHVLSAEFRSQAPRRALPAGLRLSRGALYAASATTLATAVACSSVDAPVDAGRRDSGAKADSGSDDEYAPAYGAPPVDDDDDDSGLKVDSGPPDGGDESDAGEDAQSGTLYGGPPSDGG
jgi:hypothetical protein